MQVLLTAATPFEIAPTISWLEQAFEQKGIGQFNRGELELQLCVTGIGMLATSWRLSAAFAQKKIDFALNAGISGAIAPALNMGDVVHIHEETLADLGVEEADGRFVDLFELGFVQADTFPFTAGRLLNPAAIQDNFLPNASGITVNKAHGTADSIARIREKYPYAQVESMEGAAFFYGCLQANVPFVEIRSISNYVEPRNRAGWDIPQAIQNLNAVLQEMLEGLV